MTNQRILQIIREETAHQEGLLFEGMTYVPTKGYRNNQLMEVYGADGKQLLTEGAIDTIQAVLNWAGFIPVVGDALDGINALIYFIRKLWMDGIFSIVAIIPVVGQPIGNGLRWLFDLVGRPVVNIIKKLTTNGKGAAKMFFDLFTTTSKKAQGIMKPIIDAAKSGASKIVGLLNKINMKAINKKILDVSWGWVAFPGWIVKMLDGFVSQLRKFFSHIASPPPAVVHITQKKGERLAHGLLPHEEEEAKKQYNSGDVDKKKYPNESDYLEAQVKLKNQKELMDKERKKMSNAIRNVGDKLTQQSIKNVLAWMKKKEGNEIKLWSKLEGVVKLVQQAVGVKPDGSFGTDTEKAVKIAQKKHGLAQDGVVGPETWKKLTATNFRT